MSTVPPTLCWICRSRPATTREHRLKQTDARDLLGAVSAQNPGFFNDQTRKNRWVPSTDAKILKHKLNLCLQCNSALTQPYDKAWETLATALLARPARGGSTIHANRLIRTNTHQVLLGAHLFLAKKLGCSLVDAGRFDDTEFLAEALMRGKACPYLYATLFPPRKLGYYVAAGETDIDVFIDRTSGELRRVHASYSIAGATFFMVYAREGELVHYSGQLWHPSQHTSRIVVRTIHTPPAEAPAGAA